MLNWALNILKPILKKPRQQTQAGTFKVCKSAEFKNSFSSIYAMRAKIIRKITVSASWWSLCDIFFITLQEHSGGSRGGALGRGPEGPTPYFLTKMRPEGPKKIFLESPPPSPVRRSGSATATFCVRVFKPQTNDFSTELLYNSNIYSCVSQPNHFFSPR